MTDSKGYDTTRGHPYLDGNYEEGCFSYGSYEQRKGGHYGGVDPNIVDYDDGYGSEGNGEYGLNHLSVSAMYDHYNGEEDTNESGSGHRILLSILETAFQEYRGETVKADTPTSTSTANSSSNRSSLRSNHREYLESTWKAIRTHWLWAHETVEERSIGARWKGESDLAPLHLICKLTSNPPTDILEEIVAAAPEVTEWEDDHGWLPLHHACMHGASTEVLKLLTQVYPESTVAKDAHSRTPLHLYATRGISDHYNPVTLATNVRLLCAFHSSNEETYDGFYPAEVRDKAGMLPMHYACAYGTTQSVLRVLDEAFPESLEARDDHDRTPLHFVMVNAQRGASPGVLGYLLGHYEDEAAETLDNSNFEHSNNGAVSLAPRIHRTASVNVRDSEGNLPLHLLNIGLIGADFDQNPEKLNQLSECLKLYLDAHPHVSTDFLAALQALPDPLQDVAVVHPHVRNILNAKIVQRFPTSILVSLSRAQTKTIQTHKSIMLSQTDSNTSFFLNFDVWQMLDGIMLVIMIVCFELATSRYVDQVVKDGLIERTHLLSSPLVMLYVTAAYFFLRELIQVIASLALGIFGSWLYDTTNWLDVLVIVLVTYYTTAMTLGDPQEFKNEMGDYDDLGGFRTGTALTKGILWMAVVFFLKSTQVDFAVFLNGVFYVVQRLVAFLLAILVILISFAQMFWLVYHEHSVCKFSCGEGDYQCEADMEGCSYPHCEFGDSFLKVSV